MKVAILQACIQLQSPSRYDVTVRVARDDGIPRPGGLRGRSQPGSIQRERKRPQRAHGRGDHLRRRRRRARPARSGCRRLAVVAGALNAEDPLRSPAGERPVPAVVRRFEEHRLPELVVAAGARDPDVSHAAAAPGRLPVRLAGDPGGPVPSRLALVHLAQSRGSRPWPSPSTPSPLVSAAPPYREPRGRWRGSRARQQPGGRRACVRMDASETDVRSITMQFSTSGWLPAARRGTAGPGSSHLPSRPGRTARPAPPRRPRRIRGSGRRAARRRRRT
jgi:hypothetical protein